MINQMGNIQYETKQYIAWMYQSLFFAITSMLAF